MCSWVGAPARWANQVLIVRMFGIADPGRPVARGHGVHGKKVRGEGAGAELRGAGYGAGRGFV